MPFMSRMRELYGVEPALMLQHFRHWLEGHLASDRNIHDGEVWNYVSVKRLVEVFPYWTAKKVRTILGKLVEVGALKTGNYNQNQYDRTVWYAIPGFLSEYRNGQTAICPNRQMEMPQRANLYQIPTKRT